MFMCFARGVGDVDDWVMLYLVFYVICLGIEGRS